MTTATQIDQRVWDQFQLDPTDNARAHYIAKMMKEGKINIGGGSGTTASASPLYDHYRTLYQETRDLYIHENQLLTQTRRLVDQLHAKLRKAREETSEKATRNRWTPDNRLQIWRASVCAAFEQRTCDHDDSGQKIAWAVRKRALDWLRFHLWRLHEFDASTLRTATLAFHADSRGDRRQYIPKSLEAMVGASNRAPPPPVDWLSVRDRIQKD